MTKMRIFIRIVFVIFIANGIDCLGKVCDNCCDCFKEEIKKDEEKQKKEGEGGEEKKEEKKDEKNDEEKKDGNKDDKKDDEEKKDEEEKKEEIEEYEEIKEDEENKAKSLVNKDWFKAKENKPVLKIFKKKDNNEGNGDKISIKLKGKDNTKITYLQKKGDEDPLNLEGKKYAFFEIKRNTDKTVYLYCSDIESEEDIGGIFEETTHVSISVIACDTEKVKNMKDMFHKCESLTKLDLKNFNTTNVTGMRGMFSNCSSLENLDLNNFNTTKVTDMGYMFFGCSSLTKLYLNNFVTTNVTDMESMFMGCNSFPEDIRNKLDNVEAIIAFFKKNK